MKLTAITTALAMTFAVALLAQPVQKADTLILSRIKKEAFERSQVMDIVSELTDIHGPRLTNSPGYQNAANYAKSTMELWGLSNVHFDTWDEEFGRGWFLKKFSLHSISPSYFPVIASPAAWSPAIKGTIQAEAIYMDAKTDADLQKYKGKLKGKFVLMGEPVKVKPGFKPDARRYKDSTLLIMANAGIDPPFDMSWIKEYWEGYQAATRKAEFCLKEGALAILEPSFAPQGEDGTVIVHDVYLPYNPSRTLFDPGKPAANPATTIPLMGVSDEHYNRMIRQINKGLTVKLELTLDAGTTPPAPGFNIIAEIEGTDLKDEIVMIGAHFDSWHSATGATDNAAGSAVMMETMRILQSLGVKPRRTIRLGLWGGEEQGLIGSKNYVKRMFGQPIDKQYPYDSIRLKPGAEKFSVYFNMDNGTGKYRGIYLQGNENARTMLKEWLAPFGKMGASTITSQNTYGTDHESFDDIGLPGFQFIQDPIEYYLRTHHTNMDVYDKLLEDDMKHNAAMTAWFTWMAASSDQKVPRE